MTRFHGSSCRPARPREGPRWDHPPMPLAPPGGGPCDPRADPEGGPSTPRPSRREAMRPRCSPRGRPIHRPLFRGEALEGRVMLAAADVVDPIDLPADPPILLLLDRDGSGSATGSIDLPSEADQFQFEAV